MKNKAKKIVCFAAATILLSGVCQAGELYIWTDKNGKQHITDTEPPASAKKLIDRVTYKRNSASEIRAWQSREDRSLAIREQADAIRSDRIAADQARSDAASSARSSREAIQAERNARADQYRKVVDAVGGSRTFGAYGSTVENLTKIREEQIRNGTEPAYSVDKEIKYQQHQIDQLRMQSDIDRITKRK